MTKYSNSWILILILLIAGCESPTSEKSTEDEPKTEAMEDLNSDRIDQKYKLYKAEGSESFPGATLELTAPTAQKVQTGKVDFKFDVNGFELGTQTPDAENRGIANSDKGQHIHYIQNNGPYSAHYTSNFSKEMEEGHHVILSFLSRSYHESVKNGQAHTLTLLTVGNPSDEMSFDPNDQHLFYSRPKGTYSGKDTEKLMIDFFLMNTEISPEGNKVRATINGETHMITEWAPHYIKGLEKGKLTLKLELVDKDLNLIPGPYNQVERTVTLE